MSVQRFARQRNERDNPLRPVVLQGTGSDMQYPEFYGIQIEFTQNSIRFHFNKIFKKNKYKIVADMEHFKNVNRYDTERVTKQYEKPCNIGTFTAKKVNDWINYYTTTK